MPDTQALKNAFLLLNEWAQGDQMTEKPTQSLERFEHRAGMSHRPTVAFIKVLWTVPVAWLCVGSEEGKDLV